MPTIFKAHYIECLTIRWPHHIVMYVVHRLSVYCTSLCDVADEIPIVLCSTSEYFHFKTSAAAYLHLIQQIEAPLTTGEL